MSKRKCVGQVQYFRSRIDGQKQPCAVCATDAGNEPKALIIEVSPGASAATIDQAVPVTEQIAEVAARHGRSCVVLRPTGRGPGSVYQNYGEVDLLEAVEHVCGVYAIDRDRVSVTGSSMGGAATWYLISHYPDLFAAAAPFCGYCDYRLWEKPGGSTFHRHEWEELSWQSRSAALLVDNLEHTPIWSIHGEWDRSIGGGVPVEHSRQMGRLLSEKGFEHRLTMVPKTGHGCRTPELFEQVILWLLAQKKERAPQHVALATYGLRHNRSYWVRIEQMIRYDRRSLVDARIEDDARVVGRTENVMALSLGPAGDGVDQTVIIDGQRLGRLGLDRWRTFQRGSNGSWEIDAELAADYKRHGVSGPIGDLFYEPTVLVPGTTGTEEETFFNNWVASHAAGYFASRNGGVHRGGILGQNSVELPVVRDVELSEQMLAECNLLLYGTASSNSILARFEGKIPVSFRDGTIHLADKTYSAAGAAVFAVFAHPANAERYVAVHGGVTADAVTWGSHLDMMLLGDYIVYNGGELLDWGFWNSNWSSPP